MTHYQRAYCIAVTALSLANLAVVALAVLGRDSQNRRQ